LKTSWSRPQAAAPVSTADSSAATTSGQPKVSPSVGAPAPVSITTASAM